MKRFPVFLDVCGRPCLVVGAGRVGLAKAKSLVDAGASVLAVDPAPGAQAAAMAGLTIEARAFRSDDCRGRFLVFACTGDAGVNEAVAAAARAAGALCCRADDGAEGDFTTGATLRRGDVCIAVSTGGASPGLSIEARDRVATVVGEEFGEAAHLLGTLRDRLGPNAGNRAAALGGNLARDVVAALESGARPQAEALVEEAFVTSRARTTASEGDQCTR